jgi:uncharacterized protein (TIGR02147 family)
MNVFLYTNYRHFLTEHLKNLPKQGHGELTKMARTLGVHPTLLSLILSGERELTHEQAYDLCQHIGMSSLETEYFTLLVQMARAGNHRYKKFIQQKLDHLKAENAKMSSHFGHERTLSEQQSSIFYSTWMYSAIRIFTSVAEGGVNLEEIRNRFDLPIETVTEIIQFLVSSQLIVEEKNRFKVGPQRTFLERGSPHLLKHHSNWRIKALHQADRKTERAMIFTCPFSVSKVDFEKIRSEIAELLEKFSKTIKETNAEDVACLNIDLFWLEK